MDYGFIYIGQKDKYWYWEFTNIVKKLILIAINKLVVDYNQLYKTLFAFYIIMI